MDTLLDELSIANKEWSSIKACNNVKSFDDDGAMIGLDIGKTEKITKILLTGYEGHFR